jgi:hypothetical protein
MAADMLSSDWMHAISIDLAQTAPFLRQIKVWLRLPVRGCQLTLKKETMRAQFAMRGRMLFERGSFSSPSGGMCWNPYVLGAYKAFPMRR